MPKSTGAFTRLAMQSILAVLEIALVIAIFLAINHFIIFFLWPMYEQLLIFPGTEELAVRLWIFFEAIRFANIAFILFGVGHAIWRILDNLISWSSTKK